MGGNPLSYTDFYGLAGGIGPVLKGQAGVAQIMQQLYSNSALGNFGQEITLDVPGKGSVRLDIGSYDPVTGNLELTEVKNGPSARLTTNQNACFRDVENGNFIPRGNNAKNLGLEIGKLGGGAKGTTLNIENLGGANVRMPVIVEPDAVPVIQEPIFEPLRVRVGRILLP